MYHILITNAGTEGSANLLVGKFLSFYQLGAEFLQNILGSDLGEAAVSGGVKRDLNSLPRT